MVSSRVTKENMEMQLPLPREVPEILKIYCVIPDLPSLLLCFLQTPRDSHLFLDRTFSA
jgi:hypothetical protein